MYLYAGGRFWQDEGMKAIPVPGRERILKLYDQGKSTGEIAAGFGYCVAAVRPVRQHFKAQGTLEPQTHRCGRKSPLTAARQPRLQQLLNANQDADGILRFELRGWNTQLIRGASRKEIPISSSFKSGGWCKLRPRFPTPVPLCN